jgi:hypothetical protein
MMKKLPFLILSLFFLFTLCQQRDVTAVAIASEHDTQP